MATNDFVRFLLLEYKLFRKFYGLQSTLFAQFHRRASAYLFFLIESRSASVQQCCLTVDLIRF